jgi:hypothetical protein
MSNSEPKVFASLSSGLLARKGAARPAMKPQGFGQMGGGNLEDLGWDDMGFEPPKPAEAPVRDDEHDAFGEEIPEQPLRNPVAALTPVASPVHDQQAELADHFGAADEGGDEEVDETAELYEGDEDEDEDEAAPAAEVVVIPARAPKAAPPAAPRRQPKSRSAPGSNGKTAFTLRLDPARHLKLRLACAVNGRSAQQIVTDALDQLLAEMPELDSMAERAPAAKRANN